MGALTGQPANLTVSRLYLPSDSGLDIPELELTVKDKTHYSVTFNDKPMVGGVGILGQQRYCS